MNIPDAIEIAVAVAVTAALVWASVTDVRQRRIPNLCVAILLALFVAWSVAALGAHLISGLEAGAIALVLTVALWAGGVFGAGDSKLFAAVALFMGLGYLPYFAVATALAGGGLAVISLARNPTRALAIFTLRGKGDSGPGVPYGVAIGMGGALVLWAMLTGWLLPYGYGQPPRPTVHNIERSLAGGHPWGV
ncbi:A24 family peptidase [Caulobacter sp. KR2-114]|uniref:A24 family peptidase n=1 Tax=Caulobacter sp. KR2-114 TaxID=3400912 RepID=UPI003C03F237